MRRTTLLACLLGVICLPLAAHASPIDSMLDSMKGELQRNIEQLKVPDYPPPYYIAYLMRDLESVGYLARFGTPVKREQTRQRLVYADVRVGSAEMDNTEDPYPGMDIDYSDPIYLTWAPLQDQDLAMRRTLWMLTDREYKKSVSSYLKVKAKGIYEGKSEDFSGSFTPAPVIDNVAKKALLPKKTDEYLERVKLLSELIDQEPMVFEL